MADFTTDVRDDGDYGSAFGSDRIIPIRTLGHVRAHERRRQRVLGLLVLAALGATVWLGVLLTLPPGRTLAYVAFFAPLFVALASASAAMLYRTQIWPRFDEDESFLVALRRGALAAAAVLTNLGLLAAGHWGMLVAALTVLACVAVDHAMERRTIH